MKRRDLIKKLTDNGWILKRHGSEHDIYVNPNSIGKQTEIQVPRHKEIKEPTANKILRDAGLR